MEITPLGYQKFGATGWREDGGDGKVADKNVDTCEERLQDIYSRITTLETTSGQGNNGVIDLGTF
jgi:hypothetical protein